MSSVTPETPGELTMEKLVSLSRRRGFVFPSSEIYGGLSSCWDYGPLGVELKRNIKDRWWRSMVQERDDVVGLDTSILMHPDVWRASGHLENFTDPLVECKTCHRRWRADELAGNTCTECGGELSPPRRFNLLFKTFMGPVEDAAHVVYLRPETAQGIFLNFPNVINTTRKRLPLGIAQIGKSFRNEITTGNFIFRSREFEQMEMEYFVPPDEAEEWFGYWLQARYDWYIGLGISANNLRVRPHSQDELAHYSKACCDIEYRFPWGWAELEGVANRGDYDLREHSKASGKDMSYLEPDSGGQYLPYVIEPSAGVDRSTLAFLCEAYSEEPDQEEVRVVLHLHPLLAPYKVAVLPLSRREALDQMARDIYARLRGQFMATYDNTQSIGRRYRRQDEIGTPYCVTIDFQSLEDQMVTIRDRDSMKQIRVPVPNLSQIIGKKLGGEPFDVLPQDSEYWRGF